MKIKSIIPPTIFISAVTAFMTSTKQLNAQIVIDKGEGGYEY